MTISTKIDQILNESLTIYTAFILVTVDKDVDRMDIFNGLRAIPNVVIVKPKDSDYLNGRETDTIGYSYVNLKFIAKDTPVKALRQIKHDALSGGINTSKVMGLRGFKINVGNIKQV